MRPSRPSADRLRSRRVAKRDLKAGERLDGIGGFCTYGLIDNAESARGMRALPIGLSEGCVLKRNLSKDAVISFDDVDAFPGIAGTLWQEQNARWPLAKKAPGSPRCRPKLSREFDERQSLPSGRAGAFFSPAHRL